MVVVRWNCQKVGEKIKQPALMVTAENDVILTPSMSKIMDPWVPSLSRVHLDGAHWVHIEKHEEFNQSLLQWLHSQFKKSKY